MSTNYHNQLKALHRAVIHKDFNAMLALTKLSRHNEISTQTRINIYAKGYHIRLQDATFSDYPALAHLMGEKELKQAISNFTQATPSCDWDLNLYPCRLTEYITKVSDNKGIIALCQLEAAISKTYWQPHSPALSAETLSMLDEEAFGNLRFTFRKASKLLSLPADAETYLSYFRDENPLSHVPEAAIHMLIIRPDKHVMRYVLEQEEYDLLNALHEGKSFDEALSNASNAELLAQKLPTYLSNWFERGVFSSSF